MLESEDDGVRTEQKLETANVALAAIADEDFIRLDLITCVRDPARPRGTATIPLYKTLAIFSFKVLSHLGS